jgi:hypothetical protein
VYRKPEHLPRQARDKHRKSETKVTFFSQNPGGYYSGSQLSPDGDWMLCNYQGDGAMTAFFEPFFESESDHFAKTGSGQT